MNMLQDDVAAPRVRPMHPGQIAGGLVVFLVVDDNKLVDARVLLLVSLARVELWMLSRR